MGKENSVFQQVAGFVALLLMVGGLVTILEWAQNSQFVAESDAVQYAAYPPPSTQTSEVILNDGTKNIHEDKASLPYPAPENNGKDYSIEQTRPTAVPGPPKFWPTDQPWPPLRIQITPLP